MNNLLQLVFTDYNWFDYQQRFPPWGTSSAAGHNLRATALSNWLLVMLWSQLL